MIRHRAEGRGHPYDPNDEQRVPLLPLAGRQVEIRATSHPTLTRAVVELGDGGSMEMSDHGLDRHGRRRWVTHLIAPAAGSMLRYRIIAADGSTRTRWHRAPVAEWATGGGWTIDQGNLGAELTLQPALTSQERVDRLENASLSWLRSCEGVHRVRVAVRLQPGERLIGFGERYDRIDQRGNRLDVRVFEPYKRQWEGSRTYLPIPFFISSGGWGAWVATSRRTWFDVGATEPGRLWIEADLDPVDPRLRLVLYSGTPQQVLAGFLDQTGPAVAPPTWVFRPWMSGNEWNTQQRVLTEVERSQEHGIPVGVVVIEAWSDEAGFAIFRDAVYEPHPDGSPHRLADFRYPTDGAWPDPQGMIDSLHRRDIRLMLWQVPLLKRRCDLTGQAVHDREVMLRRGYTVRRSDGQAYLNQGGWFPQAVLVDFTNPEAREWWIAKRRYLVEEMGVDGFKTDGGEHPWGDNLRYADGRSGAEVNNEYPVHYQAAYHDLLARYRSDGITFSRSGFTGSARYPAFWAGDEDSTWEALRAAIVAGQQAGVSGIFFWGWDIAGFSGEIPSAELYLRSTAMACFCPIMQYHSEYNEHRSPSRDRTPWNIAARTGETRVISIYRKYARLRDRLVRYLDREAGHAVSEALPLMRPLAFDDPTDEEAWAHPLQYRLGRHLIVAPVTEPDVSRTDVYLSAGQWIDLWSGDAIQGPVIVDRETPLDSIPVFVAAEAATELRCELGLIT